MLNFFYVIPLFLALCLAACSSDPPAPVIDRLPTSTSSKAEAPSAPKTSTKNRPSYKTGDWRPDTYIVKKGDTLFSIGLEHGYYYKDIAQANNIAAPYNINVGQTLKLGALKEKPLNPENKATTVNSDGVVITPINTESSSTSTNASNTAAKAPTVIAISQPKAIREPYSEEALKKPLPLPKATIEKPTANTATTKPTVATSTEKNIADEKSEVKTEAKPETKITAESPEDIDWAWPTKGKVSANFNEASNKGLDISGTSGQAVNAAAAGKVIYSGSDLRGYGKLVIIKHNSTYLSVYAHNSLILAKEGQQVSRGQKIAEMGSTDSNTVKLHFEIRRQGKSVDPSKYLTSN
jgi:lipoprotein NlpD